MLKYNINFIIIYKQYIKTLNLPVWSGPLCVPSFRAPVLVSTCRKIVPSPKNSGFLASTTIVSKYVFQFL